MRPAASDYRTRWRVRAGTHIILEHLCVRWSAYLHARIRKTTASRRHRLVVAPRRIAGLTVAPIIICVHLFPITLLEFELTLPDEA